LFNKAGISWAGFGAYIDITESELSLSNGYYLAKIKLSSPLPTKIQDPAGVIEWDILIDSDCDAGTGWHSPLLFNDIGVDYYLCLALTKSGYRASAQDVKTHAQGSIEYEIDGNIVELRFPPETIGKPDSFNYIVAVRKYAKAGDPNTLEVADKAPNEGHYVFPNHHISPESTQQEDFDEVIDRLNSPRLVAQYAVDNISYDFESQERILSGEEIEWKTPSQTFALKKGNCNDQGRFALYCLLQNGYAYDDFQNNNRAACCLRAYIGEDEPGVGHVSCLYKDGADVFYIINLGKTIPGAGGIEGPFTTIEQAADATYPEWKMYILFNIHNEVTYGPKMK